MSLRINHNISSMNGHRQLMKNNDMMSKSLERLSSGLRINRAADGAAGLVISEQMRAQITGLSQAVSNSETAVSMVQTTEGALDEVNSLLNKARELTLHANNSGANDTNQLAADQAELDNVIQTISRIADVTQFGTKKLLDGSLNGATNVGTNLSHIKVGNLANNAGIAAGSMSVAVVGGIKESVSMNNSGAAVDSYVFTAATTGLAVGAGSVASGVVVTLAVGTGSVSVTTASGGATAASALATQLNTALSGAGLGYTVAAGSGAMVVSRSTAGAADITSSITFARAGSAGTKESITSTLIANTGSAGTASGAATAIFSSTYLSGVSSASTVTSGTQFSYTISTATGTLTGSVTVGTGGSTMAVVLSGLQTKITSGAGSFSGATLALNSPVSSGMEFSLTRGTDAEAVDFSFSLSIDFKNNPNVQSEVHALRLDNVAVYTGTASSDADATYVTTAGSGVAATALTGTTEIGSGSAINLTINGQTFVATGGQTLTAAATSLQTKAIAAGFTNTKVQFLATGTALSGTANPGYVGSTGSIPNAGGSFVVYNTDGADFNVTLAVDQKVGVDVAANTSEVTAGAQTSSTLNLTTATQVRTTGVATNAAVTISSTTGGSSTVTSGADTMATITTTSGLAISLTQSRISSSGVATMSLTTGMQDLGYNDFSMEVASGYSSAGGATSFTLNNGAEFQVGANALQLVGVVVSNSSSTELGRGVSSSLSSLDDLLSSNAGALTNGLGSEALKVIDAAIDEITNQRGKLGAFQANTLESGLNSLRVSKENLTAAESTIRDVDFAEESAAFTRNQILVQASTSMLAQANQMPQNVLKLLG